MSEKLKFDSEAATEYDRGIRRMLPTYDGLLRLSCSALRLYAKETADVLIIGAGGGNELIEFASLNPAWTFTAADPSEAMLAEAQLKAESFNNRVTFINGSAGDVSEDAQFDAAACLLVLHFIETKEEKLSLLREIRKRLKPGSPFVIASMSGNREDPAFNVLVKIWRQNWLDRSPLSEVQVMEMEKSVRALSFVSCEEIEGLLREAGFGGVTQFFQTTFFSAWMCVAD